MSKYGKIKGWISKTPYLEPHVLLAHVSQFLVQQVLVLSFLSIFLIAVGLISLSIKQISIDVTVVTPYLLNHTVLFDNLEVIIL